MRTSGRFGVCVWVACFAAACGAPKSTPPAPTPNASHFTLECPLHAVGAFDVARSLIPGQRLDCRASFRDRTGIYAPEAPVAFFVEAGRVPPQAPVLGGGGASVVWETALPLPVDVAPAAFTWAPLRDATHTGEYLAPLWLEPFHWVVDPLSLAAVEPSMRTYTGREPSRIDPIRKALDGGALINNPRDNVVTMIAVVPGEEAFTDENGDWTWNEGEPFVDLTEPFVDANDNGTWDPDEFFLDTNHNQRWDGKNGQWDGHTDLWVQERVLWTGVPALEDMTGSGASVGVPAPMVLLCPAPTPLGGYCAQAGPPARASVFLADPWLNAIARTDASDGCTASRHDPSVAVTTARLWADSGARSTSPLGDWLTIQVTDARNPSAPPQQQVPKHDPTPFQWDVQCSFTSSGRVERVTVPVVGTTE